MRIKDLEVGMEVATKNLSYDPNSAPARAVVISLDHEPASSHWAYRSSRITGTALPVPDVLSASGGTVEAPVVPYRPYTRREWVTLAWVIDNEVRAGAFRAQEIEGPYQEVADRRAEARKAQAKRRDADREHAQELEGRKEVVRTAFEPVLGVRPNGGHRRHEFTLTLEQAEALASAIQEARS